MYVHSPFVALDIFEVIFMGVFHWVRLFYECWKIGHGTGLKACFRFMTGHLKLDENVLKSCNFPGGVPDA